MYYTNKVITEQAEELAAVPDDEEVKQLDEAKAATAAARAAATRFQDSPMWVRALLVLCTVLLMLSAYCLVFMKSRLFQPFKLTDCRDYLGQCAACRHRRPPRRSRLHVAHRLSRSDVRALHRAPGRRTTISKPWAPPPLAL